MALSHIFTLHPLSCVQGPQRLCPSLHTVPTAYLYFKLNKILAMSWFSWKSIFQKHLSFNLIFKCAFISEESNIASVSSAYSYAHVQSHEHRSPRRAKTRMRPQKHIGAHMQVRVHGSTDSGA